MRVIMHARVNGSNKWTDADHYPKGLIRISVASKPFSQKIIVHRVDGYREEDRADSRTVLPNFAAFLMEFTEYDDIKLANIGDV